MVPEFWERRSVQAVTGAVSLTLLGALFRVLAQARLRRRVAQLEQERAVHRERQRIAADLHDDLGAGLTEALLAGEALERQALTTTATPEPATRLVGRLRSLAGTLDQVVWTVSPEQDSVPALADYLCEYAQEFFASTAIRCRFDVAEDFPASPLPARTRHQVFLAVKEALNNAAKHSRASEVFLRVRCEAADLVVVVEDNGVGFHPDEPRAGYGQRSLRRRLAALGGRLLVSSAPGQGTRVALRLPLPVRPPAVD